MKSIPSVQKYMTCAPKSIGYDQPLTHAIEYMRELHIRHLPVLKGGKLIGVISDRDIKLALSLKGLDPDQTRVDDISTAEPYFTPPETPLNEVMLTMAQNKYGSTLVVDNGKLVGIFTETDAYRVLAEVLESRFHRKGA